MSKKYISLLLMIFVLLGCQESDLALKEQCAKYVEKSHKLYGEEKNINAVETLYLYIYEGTFYSKAKSTCITKYTEHTPNHEIQHHYLDELTGNDVYKDMFNFRDYENELNLLK